MRIHIETLARLVLTRLNESPSPAPANFNQEEGLSLHGMIAAFAPEGTARAVMEAELETLDDFSHFGGSVGWLGNGAGFVMLPADFLRLVSFRMSDWTMPVSTPVTPDSPLWRLQSLPCKGVRGRPSRPVCRILQRGVGRILEFYSSLSEEATVKEGLYVARPFIDAEGYIRMPAACVNSAADHIAALVGEALCR